MMTVRQAYSQRAAEYVAALGEMATVHPLDELLVSNWAKATGGPVLDAGSGPATGRSTLRRRALTQRASTWCRSSSRAPAARTPMCTMPSAVLTLSPTTTRRLLAYSLVHHEPDQIGRPLGEFARILRPGGALLVGFFEGAELQPFDRAIIGAYRWPISALGAELSAAGFEVVETHSRTGPNHRPHAAVVAQRTFER